MHSVNLDLLRTGSYYPNGRPRDPHAHHRAELTALAEAARRAIWRNRLACLASLMSRFTARPPILDACPKQPT